MSKKILWSLGFGGLLAFGLGCASRGFAPVAVTKDPSAVQSCQKIDEVKPAPNLQYADPEKALLDLAYEKGANTLLIQSDDPPLGVAYQCSMPEANQAK